MPLVTSVKSLRNALEFLHGFIGEEYELCQVEALEPMWIEMTHTSNYINSVAVNVLKYIGIIIYWKNSR